MALYIFYLPETEGSAGSNEPKPSPTGTCAFYLVIDKILCCTHIEGDRYKILAIKKGPGLLPDLPEE